MTHVLRLRNGSTTLTERALLALTGLVVYMPSGKYAVRRGQYDRVLAALRAEHDRAARTARESRAREAAAIDRV